MGKNHPKTPSAKLLCLIYAADQLYVVVKLVLQSTTIGCGQARHTKGHSSNFYAIDAI